MNLTEEYIQQCKSDSEWWIGIANLVGMRLSGWTARDSALLIYKSENSPYENTITMPGYLARQILKLAGKE